MGGRDVQRILVYETPRAAGPIPRLSAETKETKRPQHGLGIIGVSKLKRILWALPTGLQGRGSGEPVGSAWAGLVSDGLEARRRVTNNQRKRQPTWDQRPRGDVPEIIEV